MPDSGSIVVAQYMGFSLGLGQLLTIITQILKNTETIPYLNKIPGVQWLIDQIDNGNPVQVRTFVGLLAVIINVLWVYNQTGEWMNFMTIMSTAATFVSAIGGYDFWFSSDKKKE